MQLDTQATLRVLIERSKRRACACGATATIEQPDIFGETTGYCKACYEALGGDEE